MKGAGGIATIGSADESEGGPAPAAVPPDTVEHVNPDPGGGSPRSGGWAPALIAVTAVIAWTGAFAWAHGDAASGAAPAAWTGLVAEWAMPTALIALAWLIVSRASSREARRFGDVARGLAGESARLETRLTAVNRELSLAREFVAAQARDLDALGRLAADRLTQSADGLRQVVAHSAARLDAVAEVSRAALDNMERLRGQLPVIATLSKDVTSQIGNAGRTASDHLEALHAGLRALDAAGTRVGEQVGTVDAAVGGALAEFHRQCERLGELSDQRFAAIAARGAEARAALDAHEADALAAVRSRAGALAEELAQLRARARSDEAAGLASLRLRLSALGDEGGSLAARLEETQARAVERWREAIAALEGDLDEAQASLARGEAGAIAASRARVEALDDQLAGLDAGIAARREQHARHGAELMAHGEAIAARLVETEARLARIAAHGGEVAARVTSGLDALGAGLERGRETLAGTDAQLAALIATSARLIELIDASAARARDDLPPALQAAETRLADIERASAGTVTAIGEASARGDRLADLLGIAASALVTRLREIASLQAAAQARADEYGATLDGTRATLGDIERRGNTLVDEARDTLAPAIAALGEATEGVLARVREAGPQAVSALTNQFVDDSSAAIERIARLSAAETAGRIEQAAAHAAGAGRAGAEQLRETVADAEALVARLEARVATAREQAEVAANDAGFARGAALIAERLNSAAIDLGGALGAEVTDAAWAAYLRGDRGVFTRRTVRLLGGGERRAVADLYGEDEAFRDLVRRYVRDFEAMLREVLSARDGDALGVTLISSDMGKLYVALAQATARLGG